MTRKFLLLVFLLVLATILHAESPYEVEWNSPSADYHGSMPLGNGQLGVNAWVNPAGELEIFLSGTDVWDDYGRLVKYGGMKIVPNASRSFSTENFRQILDVTKGTMTAEFGPKGDRIKFRLWVDANRPVVMVEIESDKPVAPQAVLQLWRKIPCENINGFETSDLFWGKNEKHPIFPDTILSEADLTAGQIGWYHTNRKLHYFDEIGKTQGLDDYPDRSDPLEGRTFGAIVSTPKPVRIRDDVLQSQSGTIHRFETVAMTCQVPPMAPVAERIKTLKLVHETNTSVSCSKRYTEHLKWWSDFFDRSHVLFSTNNENEKASVFQLNRAGILQRYINACCGRGSHPIKFNGAIFTVPAEGMSGYADYRRWGPGYWWQNTRIPYLSMPMSGDFDLMQPFIEMYSNLLPLCKFRTKKYFGFEGAYYPECIYFWGDVFPETYGFTPWNERKDKLQTNTWHKWAWVGGLEIAFMFMNYYEFTGDVDFLKQKAIPMADAVTRFFDGYYQTDSKTGKLVMSPSQALETWWKCTNPMPEIAGLAAVLDKLVQLAETVPNLSLDPADILRWKTLRAKVPPFPVRTDEKSGKKMLAAADAFDNKHNSENPELYAVYPFRLFAFEKPNVELAVNAFTARSDSGWVGWRQDDLFAAYLGMSDFVRRTMLSRATTKDKQSRFPAFWGPNYDWIPDQDHGGILRSLIQYVVMQTDGRKIYLLPALPKNWNVEFKLHAPYKTVVEGKTANGKIVELTVTPPERRKDITLCQ